MDPASVKKPGCDKDEDIQEFKEDEDAKKREEAKKLAEEDIPSYDDDEPVKKPEQKIQIDIKTDHFKSAAPGDASKGKPGPGEKGFVSIMQDDLPAKKGAVETMRFYDISLVYDKNFFTPRVFLMAYNQSNQPLPPNDIFDDIADEYAKKTVTIEAHPCLGVQQATVHPCKHADVMKHLIDTILENGGKIAPHQSLILFLKIFSSIMPNIKYDSTLDYDLE